MNKKYIIKTVSLSIVILTLISGFALIVHGSGTSGYQTPLSSVTERGIRSNSSTGVIWKNVTGKHDNNTGLSEGTHYYQAVNETGYTSFYPFNPVVSTYPITISNPPSGSGMYQQMFTFSNPSTYGINSQGSNFYITYTNGTPVYSWIESISSNNLVVWSKIPFETSNLNLEIYAESENLLSATGYIGEAPGLSSTYGEYDNGAKVFLGYFSGNSITGWTVAGTAGETTSAPSGNPSFGTYAFYANGANGNYLYTTASGQSTNMIIEFYGYVANLQDLYFLANSNGNGQMMREGNGGGWYGIASTSSWTSWAAPPDSGYWSNEWVTVGVVVEDGTATGYLSIGVNTYGSEIGSNPSNTYTVSNNGNYLGLVGDNGGGTTTQYWNGIIIRAYVSSMPTFTIRSSHVKHASLRETVAFNEEGLPNGTEWSIIVGNHEYNSTLSTIRITLLSGVYQFRVVNITGYNASPSRGVVEAFKEGINITIDFTPIDSVVVFNEEGLPPGTAWSVTLDGITKYSSNGTLSFNIKYGSEVNYTVNLPSGYSSIPPYEGFKAYQQSISLELVVSHSSYKITNNVLFLMIFIPLVLLSFIMVVIIAVKMQGLRRKVRLYR